MEETNFSLNVNGKNINVLLQALGKLPAEISMGLILDIRRQAEGQVGTITEKQPEPPNNQE